VHQLTKTVTVDGFTHPAGTWVVPMDQEDAELVLASGSILEIIADAAHPVMAGVPDRAKVFVSGSPVFSTTKEFEGTVLAKYQASGSPLVSGYA
jgi:hypothetical protein